MKTIAAALAKAQIEMGPALKDSVNPAFKSKYADLASVMAAAMPALNANGIAVIQPTGEDEIGRFVKTVLIHESGETLECRVPLIVAKNDMQGYGSAVTYARRYGLMSMAGIAPEDDDGNAAAKAPPKPEQKRRDEVSPAEVETAIAMINQIPDLKMLAGYWTGLARDAAHVAKEPLVYEAKEARKLALTAPADLAGDSIPY